MQLGANRPIWQLGTMSHMSDFATTQDLARRLLQGIAAFLGLLL
jgi:hypothetical protein